MEQISELIEVSIVIPTRDRWPMLAEAVRSATLQEDVEAEVIVVDDGSTGAAPPGDVFAANGVELVRLDPGRGVSEARNAGTRRARGEWIAFLDDDDVWSPRNLRAQLDVARSSGAAFSYAGVARLDERLGLLSIDEAPEPAELRRLILRHNAVPGGGSNILVRADLLRRLGGFDPRFSILADWDLWIRLSAVGSPAICPEPLVGYRLHPNSMQVVAIADMFAEFDLLVGKHTSAASSEGRSFHGLAFTWWVASQQWRAGRRRRAIVAYLEGLRRYGRPSNAVRGLRALARGEPLPRKRDSKSSMESREPSWLRRYR